MTIISKNLKRLFKEHELSFAEVGRQCNTSASSVTQWIQPIKPIIPRPDKLLIIAGLLHTTIEELMTNPRCKSGEVVSSKLDIRILEKTIGTFANNELLAYAYDNANIKQRAYMFNLLYSLCETTGSKEIDSAELLSMTDLPNGKQNDKKSKKKSATRGAK